MYFILDKLDAVFASKCDFDKSPLPCRGADKLKKTISSTLDEVKPLEKKAEDKKRKSISSIPAVGLPSKSRDQSKGRKHYVELLFLEKSL